MTLKTSLELAVLLQEAGAKVIFTRDSDQYLSLQQRVDLSSIFKPDVFISIHYNSFTNPNTNGIETYYYTSEKELQLAKEIHQGIIEQVGLRDRGVRYGNFYVLRENSQPAILLELGFISNYEEEKIIATAAYQKQAAKGIFNGLVEYFQYSH